MGMSYFKNITKTHFKNAEDGSWIYYPNGAMGKGRRITSQEEKDRVFESHRKTIKTLMLTGIIAGWLLGLSGIPPIPTAIVFTLLVFIALNHWRKYRHLPYAAERLGVREAAIKGSTALPKWYPHLVGILGLGSFCFAFYLPSALNRPIHELKGLIAMMVGVGLLGIVIGLITFRLQKKAAGDST